MIEIKNNKFKNPIFILKELEKEFPLIHVENLDYKNINTKSPNHVIVFENITNEIIRIAPYTKHSTDRIDYNITFGRYLLQNNDVVFNKKNKSVTVKLNSITQEELLRYIRNKVLIYLNNDITENPLGGSNYSVSEVKKIEAEIDTLNIVGADRDAVIKIRVNQGIFRDRLLSKYHSCCLCGVENNIFLIASHIKPWTDSAPEEKLDVNNGFLLCPNHDKVFDQGYITFDDTGKIMISDSLTNNDKMFLNINDDMKIKISEKTKEYLKYHRENIYKK